MAALLRPRARFRQAGRGGLAWPWRKRRAVRRLASAAAKRAGSRLRAIARLPAARALRPSDSGQAPDWPRKALGRRLAARQAGQTALASPARQRPAGPAQPGPPLRAPNGVCRAARWSFLTAVNQARTGRGHNASERGFCCQPLKGDVRHVQTHSGACRWFCHGLFRSG